MTAPNRPPLLLVGSGNRHYRAYLFAALRPHFRLWLIDSADSTWPHDYVEGVTVADTLDADALIAVARQVTASFPARGVRTFDESLVCPVARVAEELGLPGNPPETVQTCRDKASSRAVLDAAGVPQPISRTVASAEEAVAAAEEIGYPVVVKARGLAGSLGVLRVDDPTAVSDAYATASGAVWPGIPRYEEDVLVEEFLTGPEISIDAVISQGVCTPLVIARKRTGFAPFFEETGHTVDADDPLFDDAALLGQLDLVHKGIGLTEGATHTEFKLTSRGPRLATPASAGTSFRGWACCPPTHRRHPIPLSGRRLRGGRHRRTRRPVRPHDPRSPRRRRCGDESLAAPTRLPDAIPIRARHRGRRGRRSGSSRPGRRGRPGHAAEQAAEHLSGRLRCSAIGSRFLIGSRVVAGCRAAHRKKPWVRSRSRRGRGPVRRVWRSSVVKPSAAPAGSPASPCQWWRPCRAASVSAWTAPTRRPQGPAASSRNTPPRGKVADFGRVKAGFPAVEPLHPCCASTVYTVYEPRRQRSSR
ncbi:carbamoyl-phosphate synthase L chain ATP-binding protein [Streptomyces hygroscopicus]|nr:carbamoyl-phosphate synthase L chain ATP-binding protein [Streptomyces hygroscopicus]